MSPACDKHLCGTERQTEMRQTEERPHGHGGRDFSDAATCPGRPEATGSWKGRNRSFLRAYRGNVALPMP